jgi:hypothetical protein
LSTVTTRGDPISKFRADRTDLCRSRNQLKALLETLEGEEKAFIATTDAYVHGAEWARDKGREQLSTERDRIATAAGRVALALGIAIDAMQEALGATTDLHWE